jgi:hypothetical protein
MKREWQIRRATSIQLNGLQRWDQAYQHLLRWAIQAETAHDDSASPT